MPTASAEYISIFVTADCNLRCAYCYTQQCRDTRVISIDFAKKGLDDFFNSYPYRKIRFQGSGEPTLKLSFMDELLVYARKKYGEVEVELQTNGYFDSSVRKWVSDNVGIAWVSFDGLPEVHDIHPPNEDGSGTSAVVLNNIIELMKAGVTVGIRCCITSLNLHRQEEILDYLKAIGIKTVYGDNIFATDHNEHMTEKYTVPETLEYAKTFLIAKKYAQSIDMFYGSWLTVNFAEETNRNCSSCTPLPRLTTDGYVSSCDVTSEGEVGPKEFVYGKWDAAKKIILYDAKQHSLLSARTLENMEECSTCKIGKYCAGGCMGKAFLVTGSIMKIDKKACIATKYLAKHLPLGTGRERHEIEHP